MFSKLTPSRMAGFHNLWSPGFMWVNPSGYLAAPKIIILHILKIIYTGETCWYYCLPVWSTRRAAKSGLRKFWLRYPSKFGKMNPEILDLNFSWLYFYHGSVASLGAAYNHPYQPAKQELMSSTAQFNIHPATPYYRVSQKNALSEWCWSHSALAQSQVSSTPCVWKLIFGRFVLRLCLFKPSQVIFMIKFSPTALSFGYDFVLLVHFFGTPCIFSASLVQNKVSNATVAMNNTVQYNICEQSRNPASKNL